MRLSEPLEGLEAEQTHPCPRSLATQTIGATTK